jgi:hypothetical protein
MEYDHRVIIRFLCKERVSPKTFPDLSRHSSETLLTASAAFGGGASMLDKDAKTGMTRCDPAGHELIFLRSEVWYCWMNSVFIPLIRFTEARGVSHLTILSHLGELPDTKVFHLRWIPHELTTSL